MRKLGDIMHDLEYLVFEMVDDHDMQWGEMLNLMYGYLKVHRPDAQEEYVEGGNPVFFYGPEELLVARQKPKRKKLMRRPKP